MPQINPLPRHVWIVEDDPVFRETLALVLSTSCRVRTFERSEDVVSALGAGEALPNVLLLDIHLPGTSGLDALPALRRHAPHLPIAMLTVMDDDRHVFQALHRGASGYLLKNTPLPRIVEALDELEAGGMSMSVPVARRVMAHFRESATPDVEPLTVREQEVLEAMTRGLSQRAIGESLHLSRSTVNFHVQRIYEKLHVNSAAGAVARALRDRLV